MNKNRNDFLFIFIYQLPWTLLIFGIMVGVNICFANARQFLFGNGLLSIIIGSLICGTFNYWWITHWGKRLFAPAPER